MAFRAVARSAPSISRATFSSFSTKPTKPTNISTKKMSTTSIPRNNRLNQFQPKRSITTDELVNPTRKELDLVGRSNYSGIVATVFGATGFLGHCTVAYLGQTGCRVVCPFRGDGMNARHLKVMGDLGQIIPYPIALKDHATIRAAVQRSNIVINLLGSRRETSNFSFEDVNINIPQTLARISREEGVERFIHVSALGANEEADSQFLATKAMGEEAVRSEFSSATIVRPADIFGTGDNYVQRFAQQIRMYPVFPLLSGVEQLVQPVFVQDVGKAFIEMINREESIGQIYELAGPEVFTLRSLLGLISQAIKSESTVVSIPQDLGVFYGWMVDKMPWQLSKFTAEDVLKQRTDVILSGDPSVKTFEHLGMAPTLTRLTELARPLLNAYEPMVSDIPNEDPKTVLPF